MGAIYRHLSIEERCEVARLRTAGYSVRQIAASLDRSPSTISRELKRNGSRTQGYQPGYADQQAHARRWHGSKLERNDSLREQVLACLRQNWSPEQVAGRLALEAGRTVVSHETIYRFIYAQIARKKDYSWRHYLPRAKSKRGWRGRKGGNPASFIQLRRPLSERPADASGRDASGRDTPGHWEADLMLFGRQGQTVFALHERHSRLLIALRQPGKAADPVASAMTQVLAAFPAPWRRTVAFDNGTEFARHHRLHALGGADLLLDTHSPWQKGGVENAIGRMRRTLPRKTDLAELPDGRFDQLVRSYNNTPRKCLGYYTPAKILSDYSTNSDYFTNQVFQVLHLKCESSFPPSRE